MARIPARLRRLVVSTFALVLLSLAMVQACSVGWTPDIFVRKYRPDLPKDFYSGNLGILQNTYFRFNLIAAYRYLNGGRLAANEIIPDHRWDYLYETDPDSDRYAWNRSSDEQESDTDGSRKWLAARNRFATALDTITSERALPEGSDSQFAEDFLNCTQGAFSTAADTLQARLIAWGKDSSAFVDWLHGQDAVFANCDGNAAVQVPPAPASAPSLLKQDRAYQMAAAEFYSMQFDAARASFKAISQDELSPWHGIAGLLVVRSIGQASNTDSAFRLKQRVGGYGSAESG
jgi:hypothetical protein